MNIEGQRGTPRDKRGAFKWHNRRAIVMAGGELSGRHGVQGFSVDDLAAKAGVSRRTIFNHFSSAEDAGYEYLSDLVTRFIGAVLAELRDPPERGEQTLSSVYRDLCAAMRTRSPVEALHPLLLQVREVKESPTAALWTFRVTSAATERLEHLFRERLPDHDRLELQLVATSIINSMSVCMDAWLLRTGGELNDRSRRTWDELMSEALSVLGRGFTT